VRSSGACHTLCGAVQRAASRGAADRHECVRSFNSVWTAEGGENLELKQGWEHYGGVFANATVTKVRLVAVAVAAAGHTLSMRRAA
jgi:hypothetical protein